jgi:hypothetical protein
LGWSSSKPMWKMVHGSGGVWGPANRLLRRSTSGVIAERLSSGDRFAARHCASRSQRGAEYHLARALLGSAPSGFRPALGGAPCCGTRALSSALVPRLEVAPLLCCRPTCRGALGADTPSPPAWEAREHSGSLQPPAPTVPASPGCDPPHVRMG